MANSLSSSLVLDSISRTVITPLGGIFAPLQAFTSDLSSETYTKGQNVRLRIGNVGPSAQTNPTNWESGDSGQDNVNLPVNHYSVSWHIDPDAVEKGWRLDQLAAQAYRSFGNKIMDVVMAPLTSSGTTNFANIAIAQASLVRANLQTVWAAIANASTKNLILDAVAFSQLLPADANGFKLGQGAYGFDNWFLNTRWNGAGANVYGFAGHPGALGIITGLPVMENETKEDINTTTLSIPLAVGGTGQSASGSVITAYASTWISRATRIRWASLDIMAGAAKLDNSACRLFVSAANP
ncbi:MAG: hypothetical protein V4773_13505 [Verrucomicrobiota bacterium]